MECRYFGQNTSENTYLVFVSIIAVRTALDVGHIVCTYDRHQNVIHYDKKLRIKPGYIVLQLSLLLTEIFIKSLTMNNIIEADHWLRIMT